VLDADAELGLAVGVHGAGLAKLLEAGAGLADVVGAGQAVAAVGHLGAGAAGLHAAAAHGHVRRRVHRHGQFGVAFVFAPPNADALHAVPVLRAEGGRVQAVAPRGKARAATAATATAPGKQG